MLGEIRQGERNKKRKPEQAVYLFRDKRIKWREHLKEELYAKRKLYPAKFGGIGPVADGSLSDAAGCDRTRRKSPFFTGVSRGRNGTCAVDRRGVGYGIAVKHPARRHGGVYGSENLSGRGCSGGNAGIL